MEILYNALILFLLLTLVAGLWRIRRGPTAADRMLAAQLFGTTATAILLLLAEVSGEPALRDVALVLALLAAITVTAFTRRVRMLATADAATGNRAATDEGVDAPDGALANAGSGTRTATAGRLAETRAAASGEEGLRRTVGHPLGSGIPGAGDESNGGGHGP
jgi:multicomponent Na+:H+ antiporter subunit F